MKAASYLAVLALAGGALTLSQTAAAGGTATPAGTHVHGSVGRYRFTDSRHNGAGATCEYRRGRLASVKLSSPLAESRTHWGSLGQGVQWGAELQYRKRKTWSDVLPTNAKVQVVHDKALTKLRRASFHLSPAISSPGQYRVVETINWFNPHTAATEGSAVHVVSHYHLTQPRNVGAACPEIRHLTKPGAPTSALVGLVQVLSKDSGNNPTMLRVPLHWKATKAGGIPTCYAVRWTLMNSLGDLDSTPAGKPHTLSCKKGLSRAVTIKPDMPAATFVRWQVAARNAKGYGAWRTANGTVPNVKGRQSPEAYQELRLASLVPNSSDAGKPPTASLAFAIASEKPSSGVRRAGSFIAISIYDGP